MHSTDRYARAAERLRRWAVHGTWSRMERAARRQPKPSLWGETMAAIRHHLQSAQGGAAAHHGR